MNGAPEISVIVVSFGGTDLLRRCLASIPRRTASGIVQVIVVDNASPDGTPDMVQREYPDVRLIRSALNAGFAAGNNRGLQASSGRFVMLLNPDAQLVPGCLETCMDRLARQDGDAVVVPRLLNPDGSLQFSLRNFPTVTTAVFEALLLHRLLPRMTPGFAEMIVDSAFYEDEHEIDWASGAALVTTAEVFRRVGPLDERYFLYSEETDWFLGVARAGLTAVYLPEATVIHRSSEGRNPRLMREAVRSRLLYAHKNLSPLSAAAIRAIMALGIAVRLAGWAMLSLVGNAAAGPRCSAYQAGLAAVLGFGDAEKVAHA